MSFISTLPFRSNSPYNFTSNAGGNNFKFHIKHCIADDTYFMDIDMYKNSRYEPIAHCINLTVGCDIFLPYKQYGLGTMMIVPTDSRYYNEVPHSDTIVSKFTMVWEHD